MDLKKNPKADVHKRKSTNLLIGLNAALAIILALFYYNNKPEKVKPVKKSFNNEAIEQIPPTQQEPPKAPPPPPSPDIQEIDDDSDIEEDEVQATDVDENKSLDPIITDPGDGDDKEPEIKIDNTIYTDVDEEGQYKGGEDKLREFVTTYYKMPKVAQELGISGVIFIQFVVERNGSITNIRAIAPKQRQLGYGLEEECMRVIKLTSGSWKAASRGGKPVRSYWRFPFEVDNSSGF